MKISVAVHDRREKTPTALRRIVVSVDIDRDDSGARDSTR